MLFLVEQAFVGRDEIRASLKMPLWEARRKYECECCKPTIIQGSSLQSKAIIIIITFAFFRFDSVQFYRCLLSFSLNTLQVLTLRSSLYCELESEIDKSRSKSITCP